MDSELRRLWEEKIGLGVQVGKIENVLVELLKYLKLEVVWNERGELKLKKVK